MGTASAGTAAGGAAVAAVDLGASGGRVMVGQVGHGQLDLHEAHRFANTPVRVLGTLHWDILGLYRGMLDGLGAAARAFGLASVGIDSWGVDYGLLDAGGALLGNPVHYRDTRTDGVVGEVLAKVPAADLYAVTGIQQMPINTIYQLAAAARTPQLAAARTLLLIPDLLAYWLTGEIGAEVTNASTTGLVPVSSSRWDVTLLNQLDLPVGLFPELVDAGTQVGEIKRFFEESAYAVRDVIDSEITDPTHPSISRSTISWSASKFAAWPISPRQVCKRFSTAEGPRPEFAASADAVLTAAARNRVKHAECGVQ